MLSLDLGAVCARPAMIRTGPLTPHHFDPALGQWVAAEAGADAQSAPAAAPSEELRVVTYNVWFSNLERDERTRHVLAQCRAHDPHFICLQEVVPDSLRVILADKWVRERYHTTDADGSTIEHYGVLILSRAPPTAAALRVLPSRMGRFLVTCTAVCGGVEVVAATVHLESLNSRPWREKQMRMTREELGDHPNVVWMGDFNFDDRRNWASDDDSPLEEHTLREVFAGFDDVWLAVRGDEPGLTFDTERNPMLQAMNHPDERMRYDRIMARLSSFNPTRVELLGCEAIRDLNEGAPGLGPRPLLPSDHFGLLAVFAPRDRT